MHHQEDYSRVHTSGIQLDMVLDSTDGTALLLGGTRSSLYKLSATCTLFEVVNV